MLKLNFPKDITIPQKKTVYFTLILMALLMSVTLVDAGIQYTYTSNDINVLSEINEIHDIVFNKLEKGTIINTEDIINSGFLDQKFSLSDYYTGSMFNDNTHFLDGLYNSNLTINYNGNNPNNYLDLKFQNLGLYACQKLSSINYPRYVNTVFVNDFNAKVFNVNSANVNFSNKLCKNDDTNIIKFELSK